MKETRKQKLRRKEEKERRAEERKLAILDRLLNMYGIKSLLPTFSWMTRAHLLLAINPRLEVEIAEDSKNDPLVADIKVLYERAIETRFQFSLDERTFDISLGDIFRGYFTIPELMKLIYMNIVDIKHPDTESMKASLDLVIERAAQFEKEQFAEVFGRLSYRLNEIADEYLRIDEHVIWYKMERNERYPDRLAFRLVLGRKQQVPLYLVVSDGRRKAYPCERTKFLTGLSQATWNPARLGIGGADRDLPVYVSEHAINRLHERVPLAPYFGALHRMMYDALDDPKLRPAEDTDGFLVEVGGDRKVGYFVVELSPDFVFVRTFLFLTMQGTPEAKCLRQKLGLSRADIEYFKLDSFFTLVCSDLGEDPELKRALAACGCDHLLDFPDTEKRLSWLARYRDPFRHELGLPSGAPSDDARVPDPREEKDLEELIAFSQKFLKQSQGWIV